MQIQFCRNCGKSVGPNTYVCVNCGQPPEQGTNYCPTCGTASQPDAAFCIKCGTNLGSGNPAQQSISTQLNTDLFPETMPKTWLAEAILVTLFCCLPFGIVAIVNASKVEARYHAGDYPGSQHNSEEAKKWVMISMWIGIVLAVIYVFIYILGANASRDF